MRHLKLKVTLFISLYLPAMKDIMLILKRCLLLILITAFTTSMFLHCPALIECAEINIRVITDKANYKQGDQIKISMTNNSGANIFSHIRSGTPAFCIEYIEKKNSDGSWEKLFAQCKPPHCIYDIDAPGEIKLGETAVMIWTPLLFINGTSKTMQPEPGLYRLSILYEDCKKTEWRTIYTNQFTIN